jgi:gas vesicle protein
MIRRLVNFVLGIGAGTAAGAALAALFTPAAGKDMRQGARERYQKILQESARAAEQRRAELEAELAEMTAVRQEDEEEEA